MGGTQNPDYDENNQRTETITYGRLTKALADQLQLLHDEELVGVGQDGKFGEFKIAVGDDSYDSDERTTLIQLDRLQDLLVEELHLLTDEELVGINENGSSAKFIIEQTGSESA